MDKPVTRTHSYHADGSAIGGTIHQPFHKILTSQTALSLPSSGGFHYVSEGAVSHDGIVSFSASHAHVAGSISPKSGGWSTLATVVVENLNILDVVTADRIVARISTEFPAAGYVPKVTLVGSNFVNLRIGGFPAHPVINFKLLSPPDEYPSTSWLRNAAFLDAARAQLRDRAKGSPEELGAHNRWIESDEGISQRGAVVCSLVDSIGGTFPGRSSGNVVEIAEVGRFFFGEYIVDQGSFGLTMIRAELGCPVGGHISAACIRSNGTSYP